MCSLTLTGRFFQPSNSRVGWLRGSTGAWWHLPAVQLSRVLDSWESLPAPAHAHALPVYLPSGVEILMKSVAVPALGLGDCALTPWTVHGQVGDNTLAVARHAFPLPVCSLVELLTAPGTDECTRALEVTVCGRFTCDSVQLAVTRPGVTASPAISHMTVMVS